MPTHDVLIAKLKPDDPDAERLLDMYEADTENASHETTEMTRRYLLDGQSLHVVKRQVAHDLERLGGTSWADHLAIVRGDDAV